MVIRTGGNVGWLLSLFIAATVFGVGVTTIDFFGLIGDHEVADDDGDVDAAGDDGDFADAEGDASDADSSSDAGRGSVAGHDRRHRSNPVL